MTAKFTCSKKCFIILNKIFKKLNRFTRINKSIFARIQKHRSITVKYKFCFLKPRVQKVAKIHVSDS